MTQRSDNNTPPRAKNAQAQSANSASLLPQHSHPRGPITIVAYNTKWPATFTSESQRVHAALNKAGFTPSIVTVEHIGSTSISGLGARPIVDIMIGVHKQANLNAFSIATMNEQGHAHRPFPVYPTTLASRPSFSKYDPPSTNGHVFVYQDKDWNGHLAARNYLRTHAKAAFLCYNG